MGIAKDQVRQLVQIGGGNSVQQFAAVVPSWTKEDALEIEVVVQNEDELRFNVTRCRYAEMYESLGLSELGAVLSCGRDAALIEGFKPDISSERTQTMLELRPRGHHDWPVMPTTLPVAPNPLLSSSPVSELSGHNS